jgi:hypothetical protein
MFDPSLIKQGMSGAAPTTDFAASVVLELYGHSVVLGFLLAIIGYANLVVFNGSPEKIEQKIEYLSSSATILFLCVAMSGIIILVDNNLARAFAIGAALSLVRFRAKIGKSTSNTQLLFGVLIGIACGLHEFPVAWTSMLIYTIVQSSVFVIVHFLRKGGSSNLGKDS